MLLQAEEEVEELSADSASGSGSGGRSLEGWRWSRRLVHWFSAVGCPCRARGWRNDDGLESFWVWGLADELLVAATEMEAMFELHAELSELLGFFVCVFVG